MSHIAKIIRSQVDTLTLMRIGAKAFYGIPKDEKHDGGLRIVFSPCPKIRGGGKIDIRLNGMDLYDIEILNNRGRVVKTFTDIYAEDLGGEDGVIERTTG